jgi:hypothetical protein
MNQDKERQRLAQHTAVHKEIDMGMDLTGVLKEGAVGFGWGLGVGTAAVGGLHAMHPGFRSFMNKSGKVYLVCMITSFASAYCAQQEVVRQNKTHWRKSVLAAQERAKLK